MAQELARGRHPGACGRPPNGCHDSSHRHPAVDLRFGVPNLEMSAVGIDNHTVVRLAMEHFLDRGYRQIAFCSYPLGRLAWMDVWADLFQRLAAESGLNSKLFTGTTRSRRKVTWEQDQQQLANWVRGLPKPIAVMACNDDRGLQLLDACRRADVRVPDDVSVLGVDNDEILCGLSRPPMSSVDINVEEVGYCAAELLDRLMHGESPPGEPLLLPARGRCPAVDRQPGHQRPRPLAGRALPSRPRLRRDSPERRDTGHRHGAPDFGATHEIRSGTFAQGGIDEDPTQRSQAVARRHGPVSHGRFAPNRIWQQPLLQPGVP